MEPELPIREELKLLNPDSDTWCKVCDYVLGPCYDEIGWPLFLAKWFLLAWLVVPIMEATLGPYSGTPEAWILFGFTLLFLNKFCWPDDF